jgi:hypothetical protein
LFAAGEKTGALVNRGRTKDRKFEDRKLGRHLIFLSLIFLSAQLRKGSEKACPVALRESYFTANPGASGSRQRLGGNKSFAGST